MKLTFNHGQRFAVPEKLIAILNSEISKIDKIEPDVSAITFNFRDENYSSSHGGFHPVEIRLVNSDNLWQFEYITDFSYHGEPYPELVKEIDVCFLSGQIGTIYSGCLQGEAATELISLFLSNFINYIEMNVFTVSVTFD
ncbi:DUF2787 domain-containing protein [Thalassotalea sp. PS06]|uniref:DUF2787 domain-containing protein n=1 Tax=Thalassotalea sp. PS06 TaxID=2594005 RepID=UPI0011645297|nr:DUF2787 domain-containing protein [Thalassotalea sp. PS06]QDP02189.1 DUF2787 domain-containing protein [Thalassotalea sp. PS06]